MMGKIGNHRMAEGEYLWIKEDLSTFSNEFSSYINFIIVILQSEI